MIYYSLHSPIFYHRINSKSHNNNVFGNRNKHRIILQYISLSYSELGLLQSGLPQLQLWRSQHHNINMEYRLILTPIWTKPSALSSSLIQWWTILRLVWFKLLYLNQSYIIFVKMWQISYFMDYGTTLVEIGYFEPNQVHYRCHWCPSEPHCAWFGSMLPIWTKVASFSSKCDRFHISWTTARLWLK